MAPELTNIKGDVAVADSSAGTGTKKVRRRLRKSNGEALESQKTADRKKPSPAKLKKEAEPSSQVKMVNKRKRIDDIDGKNVSSHQRKKEIKIADGRNEGKEDKKIGSGVGRHEGSKEEKNGDTRHERREDKKIGNGIGIGIGIGFGFGRDEGRNEKKIEDDKNERSEDKKIGSGIGRHENEERKKKIEKKIGDYRNERNERSEDKKIESSIGRYENEERKEKKIGDDRHGRREDKKIGDGISRHEGSKEKKIQDSSRHEGRKEADKSIAGAIFMCNTKTKPDCFSYSLMGVSSAKKDSMMRIRPGMKLFLYNFDLRTMYGIFEASSGGGMELEPAAFGGFFPAQVRFKILKDCLPLPEALFRKAISYDYKTRKFNTELTAEQVKRLTELFQPNPLLRSHPEFVQAPIIQHPPPLPSKEILLQQNYREEYGSKLQKGSTPVDCNGDYQMHDARQSQHPLFLTEKEYRSYGLRAGRQVLPNSDSAPSSVVAPTTHTYENFRFDYGGQQPQNEHPSMTSDAASVQNEQGSLLFLSEKEYRAFGLKGSQELPGRRTPEGLMKGAYNPYDDSTASVVSRYLTVPGPFASIAETYYPAGAYVNASSSRQAIESGDHSLRMYPDIERLHAPNISHAMSMENPHYHQLGGNPDPSSMSVSSRYSFGGPSLSQR